MRRPRQRIRWGQRQDPLLTSDSVSIEALRGTAGGPGRGGESQYFARQLSDLDFNDRLLDLVADGSIPLLERVKFLILFSERIDEFFQVQVAGLRRQVVAGIKSLALNGSTPEQLLRDVRASLERMIRRQEALLLPQMIDPALAVEGIELCDWTSLDTADRTYLHEVFDRLILPVVTPLTVDPSHPFPYISNLSLNIGVEVRSRRDDNAWFARVKIPPNVDRLLPLPGEGDRSVPLEQIMVAFLDELFPGMDVGEPCVFRVTRDADLALDDDAADDLLLALQEELRRRRFLPVVRLEIDTRTSEEPVERLTEELGLGPDDVYRFAGALGLDFLWAIHALDRPELHDEPWNPLVPPAFTSVEREEDASIFSVLDRQDVLVHHPYDSFSASVEEMMNEAADDPSVLAIKQTLYRTSGDCPVVAALVRAARTRQAGDRAGRSSTPASTRRATSAGPGRSKTPACPRDLRPDGAQDPRQDALVVRRDGERCPALRPSRHRQLQPQDSPRCTRISAC